MARRANFAILLMLAVYPPLHADARPNLEDGPALRPLGEPGSAFVSLNRAGGASQVAPDILKLSGFFDFLVEAPAPRERPAPKAPATREPPIPPPPPGEQPVQLKLPAPPHMVPPREPPSTPSRVK